MKTTENQKTAPGLRALFEDHLKDIYWTEKALAKAITKIAKKATTPELIEVLNNHLEETEEQVLRLEKNFQIMGQKTIAKKCDAMEGLMKEA